MFKVLFSSSIRNSKGLFKAVLALPILLLSKTAISAQEEYTLAADSVTKLSLLEGVSLTFEHSLVSREFNASAVCDHVSGAVGCLIKSGTSPVTLMAAEKIILNKGATLVVDPEKIQNLENLTLNGGSIVFTNGSATLVGRPNTYVGSTTLIPGTLTSIGNLMPSRGEN